MRGHTMTRLIEDLESLHASYVDAINHAIGSGDEALAAEMADEYARDTLLLVADHERRPDRVQHSMTELNTPLRRVAARLAALRAA